MANDEQSKLLRIQLASVSTNNDESLEAADLTLGMDEDIEVKNEDWVKPFEMYWKTICNFIRIKKNQASLDQIHGKISIYAQLEPDSDDSDDEGLDVSILANKKKLKMFLGRKIRSNLLIMVDDDKYSLVNS